MIKLFGLPSTEPTFSDEVYRNDDIMNALFESFNEYMKNSYKPKPGQITKETYEVKHPLTEEGEVLTDLTYLVKIKEEVL
jgi:hypothetical protein